MTKTTALPDSAGTLLPPRNLTIDSVVAAATAIGVDTATATAAAQNLVCATVVLLPVSGKIASGKDTVAPAVFDALGVTRREHQYFAKPLKDEIDVVISDLRAWADSHGQWAINARYRASLAASLAQAHDMPVEQAAVYAGRLFDHVRINRDIHSRTRTAVMRSVLQFHGTEVRRAQDENYWVKRALVPALHSLADGVSVYFTDARFANEVNLPTQVGALSVRLDISAQTQRNRLSSRDGLSIDPAALVHSSETALDDFDGFTVRLSNEGALQDTVQAIVSGLTTAAGTHAA